MDVEECELGEQKTRETATSGQDHFQHCGVVAFPAGTQHLAEETDALMIILGGPRGGVLSFLETLEGQSVSHQLTRQHGRPVLIVPESQAQEDDQK